MGRHMRMRPWIETAMRRWFSNLIFFVCSVTCWTRTWCSTCITVYWWRCQIGLMWKLGSLWQGWYRLSTLLPFKITCFVRLMSLFFFPLVLISSDFFDQVMIKKKKNDGVNMLFLWLGNSKYQFLKYYLIILWNLVFMLRKWNSDIH